MKTYAITTTATIGTGDSVAFGYGEIFRAPCPGIHNLDVPAGTTGYVVRGEFGKARHWRVFLDVPTGILALEMTDAAARIYLRTEREGGKPARDPRGDCIAREYAAWLKGEFTMTYHGD